MKYIHSVIYAVIFVLFFSVLSPVYAGGGRYELESYSSPGLTGSEGVHVQAWITNGNRTSMSVGEKAEFRVRNPRSGDRCDTTTGVTTQNGLVFGICYANTAGQMLVYLHSIDKNEDSSPIAVYFNEAPQPVAPRVVQTTVDPIVVVSPAIAPRVITPTAVVVEVSPILEPTVPPVSPTPSLVHQDQKLVQLFVDFFHGLVAKWFKR